MTWHGGWQGNVFGYVEREGREGTRRERVIKRERRRWVVRV